MKKGGTIKTRLGHFSETLKNRNTLALNSIITLLSRQSKDTLFHVE